MKQLFAFFILITFFSGCKKYLDVKPKGYLIPQTVQDYENILNNLSMIRPLTSIVEAFTDDYKIGDFDKNNYLVNPINQAYLWNAQVFSSQIDYKYYSFYNVIYENIYQYNAVINEVDKAKDGSVERKAIAKARAKLGRALSYWYLINLYAKPYNASTAATDPGVTLVISNDINLKLAARSSVKECFEFIINDLNDAIPSLPLSASNGFQFTKGGGYGVLARTYLMMGWYDKSGEAARAALKINNKLVDYNAEYDSFWWSGRLIYEWKEDSLLQNILMPENLLVLTYSYNEFFNDFIEVSPLTEQLFTVDDIRRANFYPNFTQNGWDGTFIFSGIANNSPNPGMGTPEMYLISAEAYARSGNMTAAMTDLNFLRKHRIRSVNYNDLTVVTAKEALGLILKERRRELLFKGLRWFDMRRLNSDPDFGFTAKHYFKDGTYVELTPGSIRYVLKLPDAAINGDILQNP